MIGETLSGSSIRRARGLSMQIRSYWGFILVSLLATVSWTISCLVHVTIILRRAENEGSFCYSLKPIGRYELVRESFRLQTTISTMKFMLRLLLGLVLKGNMTLLAEAVSRAISIYTCSSRCM